MSFKIHRANQRGVAEHGWLHSQFSFSFAGYYNPSRMGFGALKVINDDVIEAGNGFRMHPHNDMEIISIITKGVLVHRDTERNYGVSTAGDIQYMSAGTGIMHSEFATEDGAVAFYQIWIQPKYQNASPLYNKRNFEQIELANRWATLVSSDGKEGSMIIRQDAAIYSTVLDKNIQITVPRVEQKHGRLLFVMRGSIEIAGFTLNERDEIQITDEEEYIVKALTESKVLLFDVPMH